MSLTTSTILVPNLSPVRCHERSRYSFPWISRKSVAGITDAVQEEYPGSVSLTVRTISFTLHLPSHLTQHPATTHHSQTEPSPLSVAIVTPLATAQARRAPIFENGIL